jgi:RHS repeat-associated protein
MNRLFALCLALLLSLTSQLSLAADPPPNSLPPMECGPGDSGAPCDGSGPASQGNTSDTDQGAGNPIHVITGNKYQNEVDMPKLPGVLGLELIRHYNSTLTKAAPGILGRGWRLSYETELTPLGNTLQVMQADGSRILFIRDPKNPSHCATQDPARGRMHIVPTPRGEEYVWTWPNGRSLHFDPRGKLTQIKAPTGEFVTLTRDPAGLLMKVTDPQGRSLVLGYPPRSRQHFNGVVHIDSPAGRYTYAYGNQDDKQATTPATTPDPNRLRLANLTRVTAPDHSTRQYHYEDPRFPHHLTGISLTADGQTQRLSTYGYDLNGLGILSTKGRPLSLDKTGRPQPGTGLQQVTLDYAKPGQTTLTDSQGRKTVYRHALIGNAHRLLEVKGPGCALCGESNVKYAYDKLGRLIETTRLSPDGRPIRTTRLTRDNLGRVAAEHQQTYTAGRPAPARLMARYEYAGSTDKPTLIARPSVVPGKEHQVHLTYNELGQIRRVTETGWAPALPSPAGGRGAGGEGDAQKPTALTRTTTYAYTRINGRSLLAQIDGPLANGPRGDPTDSDVTRVEWDARGKAVAVISPGNLTSPVQYDEAGGILAVGQSLWPTKPVWPKNASSDNAAPANIEFDSLARPVAWQAGAADLLKAAWGEAGTAAQSHMLSLTGVAGQAQRLMDDFGRVVAIRNPGMGWQTADYDVGGRLVRVIDPRGAVQRAQYDFASRLLQLEHYRPGQTTAEETIALRWLGHNKTEASVTDAEGIRRTLWTYDAQGRLIEEVQEVALNGLAPVHFALRRSADERGEQIDLSDTQGMHSRLRKIRNEQGRVEQVLLNGVLPDWLGGGRTLIRQIGWTEIAGLPFAERIQYGNGRVDHWPVEPDNSHKAVATPATSYVPEPGLVRPGERHDPAGLPALIDTDAGRLTLSWDAAGRLAGLGDGQTTERFIYDAQGRRVAKRIGKEIRYFAYDGIQLAGEADETGKLLTRYAYLGYRPVAQIVSPQGIWQRLVAWLIGPEARTFATSRTGRVLAMHDGAGNLLWQDAETPAVRQVSLAPALHQPLRDVGQYADDETGLVYHMARFFDPRTGFFLSPDPKGVADAVEHTRHDLLLNAYAYAGGYPDAFFDPDGAAKIRYFALDNGTRTAAGEMPDRGHWGFFIYDITNSLERVLYDKGGDFFSNNSNIYQLWDDPGFDIDILKDFTDYYSGGSRGYYSPASFTVNISDDKAKAIISLLTNQNLTVQDRNCLSDKANDLPVIDLGVQGMHIPQRNALAAYTVNGVVQQANGQPNRLLQCNVNSGPQDVLSTRLQKAIEIHEVQTGSIPTDKDCALNGGCPANTWNPAVNEQTNNVQPASYGWLQFTPGAIVDALVGLTTAQLAQLGISAADQQTLLSRVTNVKTWYTRLVGNGNPNAAWVAQGWAGNGTSFTADTGLSKTNYDRMVSFGEIGATLRAVHNTYAGACNGNNGTSACYWNHWQANDPVAKQALLTKASTEVGATQIKLNPYIRNLANMGEARAGFQWSALTAGPLGQ